MGILSVFFSLRVSRRDVRRKMKIFCRSMARCPERMSADGAGPTNRNEFKERGEVYYT
jgi:hypothetical protein